MRVLARLVFIAMLTVMSASSSSAASSTSVETVVLLHGVAMPALVMRRLETALRADGYRVVNLGYPSRTMPLEQIARDYLPAQLRAHGAESAARLHFVTHSMGSLVVRLYLRDNHPANLGRVVMLGPPNHGSVAADRAAHHRMLRWITGVNLHALGTGDGGVARLIGPADFDVGIIAGTASVNPLFNRWLAGPHDGAVTVESAKLAGMRDFIVVPHSHTVMLWRAAVIAQVRAFLRDGKFAQVMPPSAD